jgi:hypothetical protein
MIVSIHQPHFLPWMGYLNKAMCSDVFVWLHSVQYRKNYYQNRTKIKNVNGEPLWLTLPVHARFGVTIDEVTIADPRWRDRIRKTLEQCYRKAPHFSECWPPLMEAMAAPSDNLNEVNYRTFAAIVRMLGGKEPRIESVGDLGVSSNDPTVRLVEICSTLKATEYIAGKGGHNYLRVEEFEKAGIRVLWQAFDPASVVYRQLGGQFVPGLSVIDCLFNEGAAGTRDLVLGAWTPDGNSR